MAADAFIQIRVTPQIKARLKAIAEREDSTESAVIRGLLVSMLRVQEPVADGRSGESASVSRDSRLYVRLRVADRKLLQARALARGVPKATYVALLVRSHLHGVAPVPEAELLAVRQSVSELKAIGRALNILARSHAQSGGGPQPGQQDVLRMMKIGEVLRERIKALYKANIRSWETGDAETSAPT